MSHSHSSSRPLPLSGSAPRVIRASPSSRSRASVAQGGNKHTLSSGPEQDSWAPLLSLSLSLQRADLLASQGSQWPPSVPYLVLHWVRVPSSKPPSVLPPVASFRLPPRPTWAFLARRPRLADLTLPTRYSSRLFASARSLRTTRIFKQTLVYSVPRNFDMHEEPLWRGSRSHGWPQLLPICRHATVNYTFEAPCVSE